MGRRPEETFFQRRHTGSQQTHEKTLNITNCQGNANQSHNEMSPHACQNGVVSKWQEMSVGENIKKREPLSTIGGNVNWWALWTQYGVF